MRGVLADTGPLYAAVDRNDQNHVRAQVELVWLEDEELHVIVPYPILNETYTLILHRLGLPAGHRWLREVSGGASLLNPTADDYRMAIHLVHRYNDQPITLPDALLAVLSGRAGFPVWTYGHHLDLLRANVWR